MPIARVLPVLLAFILLPAAPSPSRAQLLVRVELAPPPLPVYVQPVIPGPDYIWVPGYWAWGPNGYFWVPGTWVFAPTPGLLWTRNGHAEWPHDGQRRAGCLPTPLPAASALLPEAGSPSENGEHRSGG